MADRTVNIRLQLRDGETVKRGLQALGTDGQRALARIERASRPASRGLLLLNDGLASVRAELMGTASRLGPLGAGLAALGPAGLAAAAGIAALTLGLSQALDTAREAIAAFDRIAKVADGVGLSTAALQEYRVAAELSGSSTEAFDRAVQAFATNMGRLRAGSGELAEQLRRLDPAFLEVLQSAGSTEEALDLLFGRLAAAETATERMTLAAAAFGRGGRDMVNIVRDGTDGLAAMRTEARDLGLVIDDHLLRQAEQLNDQLTLAGDVISTNLQQAFISLGPILVQMAQGFATLARWIATIVDLFRDVDERSTSTLIARRDELEERLARIGDRRRGRSIIARLEAELDEIKQILADREAVFDIPPLTFPTGTPGGAGTTATLDALERHIAGLERQRDQLEITRLELGNYGRALAEARDALALTQAEQAAGRALTRAEQDQILGLTDRIAQYREALDQLRFHRAADARATREAERLARDHATAEQIRAAAIERLAALLPALTAATGDAAEAQRIYNAELERIDAVYAETTDEMARHFGTLESNLKSTGREFARFATDVVTGADDMTEAFGRLLTQLASQQLTKAFGGLFDLGIDTLFGPPGGGKAAAVPAKHDGGLAGAGGVTRPLADLLPRFHAGLGPQELLAILERDELVLTAEHQRGLESMVATSGAYADAIRQIARPFDQPWPGPRAGGAGGAAAPSAPHPVAAALTLTVDLVDRTGGRVDTQVETPDPERLKLLIDRRIAAAAPRLVDTAVTETDRRAGQGRLKNIK